MTLWNNRRGIRAALVPVLATVAIAIASNAHAELAAAPPIGKIQSIQGADTAWLLTSAALVLMMTIPGLALFYGGMVRSKNVLSTLMQSFILVGVVSIQWIVCGYSLAFSPGSAILGSLGWAA
jgi:ammonium transporter, Amt family